VPSSTATTVRAAVDDLEATPPGPRAGLHRDMIHVILLAAFDAFAMFEALVTAFAIRSTSDRPLLQPVSQVHFAAVAASLTPLWILFFGLGGLYSVKQDRGRASELGRVFAVVTAGVMMLIVLDYMRFLGPIFPGRSVPGYSLALGTVFVFVCRQFVRRMLRLAWARGRGLRNVVLVGLGPIAQRIASDLGQPRSGYRIVAVVSPSHRDASYRDVPVYSTLEAALENRLALVDEVLQADADIDRHEVERLMATVTSLGLVYRFVPNQYGVYAASSSLGTVAGVPVMDVRLTALDGWGAVFKRAFDVVTSLLLLALVSPVFLVCAVAIKLSDSTGPVFYRQQRLGRGGQGIRILKFRTMRWKYSTGPGRPYADPVAAFAAMGRLDLCAEFNRDHKVHEDPRIFRFGRFMRRLSLDELPQLWNVVRGELSLIGPRPITPEELERYGAQRISFLALKPGITGLWQVSGRSDVSYDERVKLDIFYIENWSVKLDLTILARTTTAVLARRGAY
jgi:exopolysaccharide biosynthesis polyprenyl glycosylphosphotransferase